MSSMRDKSENELEGPVTEVPIDVPPRMVLVRCPHCRHVVEAGVLSQALDVCPRCGHHMRLSARRRIKLAVDAGSFVEWDAEVAPHDVLNFPGYQEKLSAAEAASREREAVVCGQATIGGERCALFVMNSAFMMGSMGSAVGEKITRCFERALADGLPVVGFTVSGGARMQEGATSLMPLADPSREVPRCPAAFPAEPRWPAPRHPQPPLEADSATPHDLVRRVRDTNRASVPTVAEQAFSGLIELHGDHLFGDDPVVVGGIALLGRRPVTVICTDRRRTTKERVARNFGSPEPEGYRKALRLMRQAEKFGRPVVCLVDTSGAYPGMEAEERGEGAAIADGIMAMSGLRVPEVSVIMGEGGSGGAIALATADRVLMLSDAVYSVVSPEACASILWKTPKRAAEAAEALGITAPTLERLGIVDGDIDATGLGTPEFAARLADRLREELAELEAMGVDELVSTRYERFRRMGRFEA